MCFFLRQTCSEQKKQIQLSFTILPAFSGIRLLHPCMIQSDVPKSSVSGGRQKNSVGWSTPATSLGTVLRF